jgi:Uma2 family endonuclease
MTTHVSSGPVLPRKGEAGPPYLREDQRFVLYGVPWKTYVALRDGLGDGSGLRMTYLEGTLELMSPSRNHENYKTLIARLVEAYAEENDLDLRGYGGMTFRKKARKRGLDPDECYSLGEMGERPDIAIEVAISKALVNKLAVYAGLLVPEVWLWEDGTLTVHGLTADGYETRARSLVLPDLDIVHLSGFVVLDVNQTRQVKEYRRWLRSQ